MVVNTSAAAFSVSEHVCYSCSGKGHRWLECKFQDVVCHKCNKHSHIFQVCQSSVSSLESSKYALTTRQLALESANCVNNGCKDDVVLSVSSVNSLHGA